MTTPIPNSVTIATLTRRPVQPSSRNVAGRLKPAPQKARRAGHSRGRGSPCLDPTSDEAGAEGHHQRLPARPFFGLAEDVECWEREEAEHGACFLKADIGEVRCLVAPIGIVKAAEARRTGIPILDGQQTVRGPVHMAELIEDVSLQSERRE